MQMKWLVFKQPSYLWHELRIDLYHVWPLTLPSLCPLLSVLQPPWLSFSAPSTRPDLLLPPSLPCILYTCCVLYLEDFLSSSTHFSLLTPLIFPVQLSITFSGKPSWHLLWVRFTCCVHFYTSPLEHVSQLILPLKLTVDIYVALTHVSTSPVLTHYIFTTTFLGEYTCSHRARTWGTVH